MTLRGHVSPPPVASARARGPLGQWAGGWRRPERAAGPGRGSFSGRPISSAGGGGTSAGSRKRGCGSLMRAGCRRCSDRRRLGPGPAAASSPPLLPPPPRPPAPLSTPLSGSRQQRGPAAAAAARGPGPAPARTPRRLQARPGLISTETRAAATSDR